MAYKIKAILIILLGNILIVGSLFGQSAQQIDAIKKFVTQNKSLNIPELEGSNNLIKNDKSRDHETIITSYKSTQKPKAGNWQSKEDYQKWINETKGDESVMELYGFVLDTSLKYFGYDIFTIRDSIAFWQNLPAPDNYILGPGDEIEISLWGEAQLNNLYTISRDGNIYIDRVGIVDLMGKSVKNAQEIILNKFKQNFATLRGKYPSSYIEVTVNATKTINVHFVGEVNIPGIHLVHPFSSVVTGLLQAGGVKTIGSLRNIVVKRNGNIIKIIDLYNYLLDGDLENNIQLIENDVIIVPHRESTIEIDGSVSRAGIYEALAGESIEKLINYAGGVKSDASGKVTISRTKPLALRSSEANNLEQYYYNLDSLKNLIAMDGDKIYVHNIPSSSMTVSIAGQVKRPGTYKYTKLMTLKDLFEIAGGIEDSEYLKTMYLDQIEIIRKNSNSTDNDIINVNLNNYLIENKLDHILLENSDLIVVHPNNNFITTNNITIEGEVKIPGLYSLQNDNESLRSIINRAGGFTDRAFPEGINIQRKNKQVIWDDYSQPLIAGDKIYVEKKPGVVEIQGQVYNPGLILFSKGRTLKSYINASGGITPLGNRKDIIVRYPNGDVNAKKFLFNPRLEEGCIITVNPKIPREPLNVNEFLRDTASIVASLALIYTAITR